MKLSSSQLEGFYAVARTRNFTKAAEAIHVTQSALSQRILNLEAEIQTTLFIRDRSGIELTEAAQELFKYCQFKDNFETEFLNRLKSHNSKELAGPIRIAGFSSVIRSLITPAVAPLLQKNPNVQLHVQTREIHELLPMLKRGEVDFIVLDHELDRDEIESVKIGTERYVLTQAKNYKGPDVYLDHDEKDETTKRYLKLAKKPSAILKRHFMDDIYGVIDGVKMGLGKAILPEHLLEEIKGLEVKDRKIALEVPVYVHFFKQPFYTRLHSSVVESLTAVLGT
jgi:DNA-binding transcriptional LysR family regulator